MNKEIKIALVEDDENLRFLVAERLQSEGYKVLESNNGEEAEKMILAEQPDIVLLDWMLPGKQGSEVCASLREKGFDKLVIMMTAKAQDIDKIGAYNFGVSDYITKPFNMDVLVAMIDSKIKFSLNNEKTESHKFGNMEHLPNTHLLIRDGRKTELTILENRILLYFPQKQKQGNKPRRTDDGSLGLQRRCKHPHAGYAHRAPPQKDREQPRFANLPANG
jgi:two-component system alkaline phosphatase synthesis response regulator PhoP